MPQNDAEAQKWFEMAAAQGDPDAMYNLEILSAEGPDAGLRADKPETGFQPKSESVKPLATPGLDAGERWILARDPEHYTIQVIALSHQEKLHAFIAEHAGPEPFAIYRQTRYDRPLWVMVRGDYADVESAREAAGSFPAGIQKRENLWIRKFGMVQRLIE